jgi:hypothetical protein
MIVPLYEAYNKLKADLEASMSEWELWTKMMINSSFKACMTKFKIQVLMLLTQLPIAWIAGLKLFSYSEEACSISVKLGFLNKNPFQSMFWAVQGMAAELSTGLIVYRYYQEIKTYYFYARRRTKRSIFQKSERENHLLPACKEQEIKDIIQKAIDTKESQTITLKSDGIDEARR